MPILPRRQPTPSLPSTSQSSPASSDIQHLLGTYERLIALNKEEFYLFFDLHDRLLNSRDYQVSFTQDGVLVSWHDWEAGCRDHGTVLWSQFLDFCDKHA